MILPPLPSVGLMMESWYERSVSSELAALMESWYEWSVSSELAAKYANNSGQSMMIENIPSRDFPILGNDHTNSLRLRYFSSNSKNCNELIHINSNMGCKFDVAFAEKEEDVFKARSTVTKSVKNAGM